MTPPPGFVSAIARDVRRPEPWARGTHDIWTDPRIAPRMLEAHLDPTTDAASRRPDVIEASVAWIASLLRPGARVLDLGCGPGLYAQHLAQRGFEVTGVDRSASSLAHARQHAHAASADITFVEGDYLEVEIAGRFDAVLLVYYDLGALDPDATDRLLRRVRGWLADDGLFLFDVLTPRSREEMDADRWGVEEAGFWAPVPHLWLETTHAYEPSLHLDQTIVVVEGEPPRVYRVWERGFTRDEIEALLHAADLEVRGLYADLCGTALDDAPTALGVVAARARSEGDG